MRDLFQAQVLAQLGEVREHLGDAPVVGLEEGLQGQDGEELVLGEVLARELRRVSGQGLPGQAQRLSGHGEWRLGHRSGGVHTPLYARPDEGINRAEAGQRVSGPRKLRGGRLFDDRVRSCTAPTAPRAFALATGRRACSGTATFTSRAGPTPPSPGPAACPWAARGTRACWSMRSWPAPSAPSRPRRSATGGACRPASSVAGGRPSASARRRGDPPPDPGGGVERG